MFAFAFPSKLEHIEIISARYALTERRITTDIIVISHDLELQL